MISWEGEESEEDLNSLLEAMRLMPEPQLSNSFIAENPGLSSTSKTVTLSHTHLDTTYSGDVCLVSVALLFPPMTFYYPN